jgi:hypothetical protein
MPETLGPVEQGGPAGAVNPTPSVRGAGGSIPSRPTTAKVLNVGGRARTKPNGAVSLGGGAQTPRKTGLACGSARAHRKIAPPCVKSSSTPRQPALIR